MCLAHRRLGGATHRFIESLTDANYDYSIGSPVSGSVRYALLLAQEDDWVSARELDGGSTGRRSQE